LKSVAGDAFVGCFDYHGKTALYVVNYDMEQPQSIALQFDGACDLQMVKEAESQDLHAEALTLDMFAGEGVLLVIN